MIAAHRETREVVGIAEVKVASDPGAVLVTYALGSCLGVTAWDPVAGVGGLLHAMLPTATVEKDHGRAQPGRYVDSGLTALFHAMYRAGAEKKRIVVKVAGGARALRTGHTDSFQVGKRNYVALKKLLWQNGVLIQGEEVGGAVSRTLALHVGTGLVTIQSEGQRREL